MKQITFTISPQDILPIGAWIPPSAYEDETYFSEEEGAVWADEYGKEDELAENNLPSSCFEIMAGTIKKQLEENTILCEHQKEALNKLKEQVDNFNPKQGLPDVYLISLPTGIGKSAVIALAPYVLEAKNVLIITPSHELSVDLGHTEENVLLKLELMKRQDYNHFVRIGNIPKPLVIENAKNAYAFKLNPLVIANTQRFDPQSSTEFERLPHDFDVVIIDEADRYSAEAWRKISDHFACCKTIFMTTTPKTIGETILANQSQPFNNFIE